MTLQLGLQLYSAALRTCVRMLSAGECQDQVRDEDEILVACLSFQVDDF